VQSRLWIALDNLLSLATERRLGYRDFFLATAEAYGGGRGLSLSIRALMRELEGASAHTLEEARRYVRRLVETGYSPVVFDCLGLPELYWLYARLRAGGARLAVYAYVNKTGRTAGFLEEFQRASMLELAESLGGSKSSSLDRIVHEVLSEPASLAQLALKAEAHLKTAVDRWVEQLVRFSTPFFVVSDHGYDFARDGEKYYLVHGRELNVLSKLAPLLVVSRPPRWRSPRCSF